MRTGRPRAGKEIACANCGKLTYRHPSTIGNKTCSLACRDAVVRAKRVKDGLARCSKCREWKPIEQFVRGRFERPHSHCKPCNAEWFAARKGGRQKPYHEAYKLAPEEKKRRLLERNQAAKQARRAVGKAPSKRDINKMYCIQDGRCAYCGCWLERYHIDHKTPISRGGTNVLENLQLTCAKCNLRKHKMTDEEFLTSKRRPVRRLLNRRPPG